ncbi:hypothetical protein BJ138DRAFT_1106158 [Hygrophoropsis aurantiaca]|uniref:Uncharacterized protein n=1 Tax=Hygrophoropsis aurantiaca TaxID=72124 RepID=A0ACB7ZWZ0_9AGAM|nr:hypothetical protein BJ138DRAFT_1106158 [Hygrophoropsis aurantiaca]
MTSVPHNAYNTHSTHGEDKLKRVLEASVDHQEVPSQAVASTVYLAEVMLTIVGGFVPLMGGGLVEVASRCNGLGPAGQRGLASWMVAYVGLGQQGQVVTKFGQERERWGGGALDYLLQSPALGGGFGQRHMVSATIRALFGLPNGEIVTTPKTYPYMVIALFLAFPPSLLAHSCFPLPSL